MLDELSDVNDWSTKAVVIAFRGGHWGLSETETPAKISIETEKPKRNSLKTENPPRIMIQTLQPLIQQRNIGLFNLYMAY